MNIKDEKEEQPRGECHGTLKRRNKDPDEGTLKVYRKILGKPGGNCMIEVEE